MFAPYYLGVLLERKGGIYAWQASQQYEVDALSPVDASRLLCKQADIASFYRDFSRAEELLTAARKRHDSRYVRYSQLYLLYLQDQYPEALQQTLTLVEAEPDYRPAIQLLALLYQLNADPGAAIDLLGNVAFNMQSVPVAHQLFTLQLEACNYAQAELCVDHIEALFLDQSTDSTGLLNRLKSDLLCAQRRYDEAVPYLELTSPFHSKVYASIKLNRDKITARKLQRNILEVPFVRQKHMTCAPASIAAVSAYLGQPIDQDVIAEEISYDGTSSFKERQWLLQQGWIPVEFEMTYATLKQLINAGFPILLSTVEPGSAHLQVVVGYDENMDVLIMRDPHYPRLQEMLAQESIEYYAADGPRCVVLADPASIGDLDNIALPARELYDIYYQINAALNLNHPEQAAELISTMSGQAPEHRLTLEARRAFAIYEQNEVQLLKMTEALQQKFPHNINLQLSKITSLSYLHSEQRKRGYLETLCEQPDCHFLIKSRLAEELRFDERELSRARKLLHQLQAQNSLHAPTLFAYAGLLWRQREFQASYEIYRFITCLEDKNEYYAASYFKAARYRKDTDKALEFLHDRFNRYRHKSSGPAISLFNALDSLHRTREGLEILETAMQALPQDGELLAFAAKEYLRVGDHEKGLSLIQHTAPLIKKSQHLELLAEFNEMRQNRDRAIEYYREILNTEPLHPNAADRLMRLLGEAGDTDAALALIDDLLRQHPDHYGLLRTKTNWADSEELDVQVDAYRALRDHHPDQAWVYLKLARIHLQQLEHDLALEMINAAIERQQFDAETHCVLGHVLAAIGNSGEARTAYRHAIELSCDCTEAYQPLIDLALDNDSQADELDYIYQHLLEQVTYGDAILEFQLLARNWLSSEALLGILKEANQVRPDLFHTWLALARQYRERDVLDLAGETLERALERFPLIPRLNFEMAEILRLQGDLPRAEQELRSVLELSPGWAVAGTHLADILESQGHYDAAVEVLQNLIKAAPTEGTPHGYLADLYWRADKRDLAIESIRQACAIAPDYNWAWDRYQEWCQINDQLPEVIDALEKTRESMPANANLVIIHARLIEDASEGTGLLENFLARHPRNIDVNIEYINLLIKLRNFDKALEICSAAQWGQRMPLSIQAKHAWVKHVQGFVNDAIAEMEIVVQTNPNYYDGWRHLTKWYSARGENDKVIENCKHCLRLYPNNPTVLCFVAEKLVEHDSPDHDQIETLLKRAFYLDPADQNNGLTYIDYLLDMERLDEAQASIDLLDRHHSNAYTLYRKMRLACLRKNIDSAMEHWRSIITDPESGGNLAWISWLRLQDFELATQAGKIIHEEREKNSYLVPEVGESLAYFIIEHRGINDLSKILKKIALPLTPFDDRVIEGYIRTLVNQSKDIPRGILNRLHDALQADSVNWGLIAYLKIHLDQSRFVVDWMSNYQQVQNQEAWMLYFYSIALRQNGQWERGSEITSAAINLPRDNYFDDLVVWQAFDSSLTGDYSTRNLFSQIDAQNLADVSQYVYALTQCMYELGDRQFNEAYDSILPHLQKIKDVASEGYGNKMAWEARKKTYFRFKHSIEAPFLERLIWGSKLKKFFG